MISYEQLAKASPKLRKVIARWSRAIDVTEATANLQDESHPSYDCEHGIERYIRSVEAERRARRRFVSAPAATLEERRIKVDFLLESEKRVGVTLETDELGRMLLSLVLA